MIFRGRNWRALLAARCLSWLSPDHPSLPWISCALFVLGGIIMLIAAPWK